MSFIIDRFRESFGLTEQRFVQVCIDAPRQYKVFTIPKRKPAERRFIAQPARGLKEMQRWLAANFLHLLPIHESAVGYRTGRGIRDNALAHRSNKFLYKFDFRNFFPSIAPKDLAYYVSKEELAISSYELELISRLLFRRSSDEGKLELCIGAPSSPLISNIVMFDFDNVISGFCHERNLVYTRYADDVCISGNQKNLVLEAGFFYKKLVRETHIPNLVLNSDKTRLISEKSSKKITGLNVTPDGRISAGRELKRKVRALLHHQRNGTLSQSDKEVLNGYLNYLRDVEPSFLDSHLYSVPPNTHDNPDE